MPGDVAPALHPLLRREVAQEADGRGENDAVACESALAFEDRLQLPLDFGAVRDYAREDVLRPHVRDLGHLDLLAERAVLLLYLLDLLVEALQCALLVLDVLLGIVDAELVRVDAGLDLRDLSELLRHRVADVELPVQGR